MLPTTWRSPRRRSARPAFRTFSLLVSLTACSACGTHNAPAPALARADARSLAALAQRIAAEAPCAQRRDIRVLQQRAIALVNRRRVPSELQDPLISGVDALAAESPVCIPVVPVAATPPSSAPAPRPDGHPQPKPPKPHDHEHGHHHGKDH